MSAPSLVIFLHGFGSRGDDFVSLARAWAPMLPNTRFAMPDAPHPGPQGQGRQWFSVIGVTPENRAERILGARAGFDDVLGATIEAHGLGERLNEVALVGFSQGTIMSLDALASGRWPVGAVVGFSGRLVIVGAPKPALATRTLLIHGEADPVIAASESVEAARVLRGWGVDVALSLEPGVAHTISPQGARQAARMLAGQ